jgi:hypothetical protein
MTYEEFKSWQAYYLVEPWGFHDREYRTASLLAQMWNVRVQKRQNIKQVKDFYRDMPSLLEEHHQQAIKAQERRAKMKTASKQEKIRMIAESFLGGGS